ncbi:MAG: FkbM family methyltransferase [Patescibacteria group bacterium]
MSLFVRVRDKILSIVLPKIKPSGYCAVRSLTNDLASLVGKSNPIIIDGGANYGEFTESCLNKYQNPTIYCFEANHGLAELLKNKFNNKSNVHIVMKALGNQVGEIQFNISRNLPSSSFLERAEQNEKYHGNTNETNAVVGVDMVKLEDVMNHCEVIDLLKLDVEGYELAVLKGANCILSKTRIIMLEVWFSDGYQGAPYFSDIDHYLREHNFKLLNLYNPYTHPDMQLTTADAVFVNQSYFPR